jgi:outer membrane protein assembly factor BamA
MVDSALAAALSVVATATLAVQPGELTRIEVVGLTRTREETVRALLPRPPPARYSSAELRELTRRLNNLGIFDFVSVAAVDECLLVHVREKWTLIPRVELATGSTLEDSSMLLGVTEYNFLGTANVVALNVSRADRGWGAELELVEHPYRRHRWAWFAAMAFATAERRFDQSARWHTATLGVDVGLTSPAWLSDHLNYTFGGFYAREAVTESSGHELPPSRHAAGSRLAFTWNAYQWDDLAPSGFEAELGGTVGFAADEHAARPRNGADVTLSGALRLSPTTALMARGAAAALTRGDANFSQTLGSVDGVRGLQDGQYFNWTQTFVNVELRQSVRFASRWALQGVAFVDAGAFEQLLATGARGSAGRALSAGAGVRLVPTWLADVVLRLDLSRLVAPEQRWFLQLGLGQYF